MAEISLFGELRKKQIGNESEKYFYFCRSCLLKLNRQVNITFKYEQDTRYVADECHRIETDEVSVSHQIGAGTVTTCFGRG